ncbi:MAG: hypothetical protein NT150_01580 [Bacteroidetes bacterium]|nr:hypothetical protein [Bacteroidota bacterium]
MKKSLFHILVPMLFAFSAEASTDGTDTLGIIKGKSSTGPSNTYTPSSFLQKYFAGLNDADKKDTLTKEGKYVPFSNMGVSGYVRPYIQYRVVDAIRPGMVNNAKENLAINGYEINNQQAGGNQEPFMLLRLEGKPTSKTSFKLEYAFDNQMDGIARTFNNAPIVGNNTPYSRRVGLYRILQFQATTVTKFGTFNITAGGGVNWYRLSPLTMWNFEYRDDMFERYPWEPENAAMTRYNSFYAVQNVARDSRWGNTGTQGFILEAKNLPGGFNGSLLYGKTDNSGGFQTYLSGTPKNLLAGRVSKIVGSNTFGVNYFSQFGFFDNTALYRIDQNIITGDARINTAHIKVFSEFGVGRYVEHGKITAANYASYFGTTIPGSDTITSYIHNWAPTATVQVDFDKKATLIPLTLMAYYIDKSVVNVNSQVTNTSNSHALGTPSNVNGVYDNTTVRGAVTDIGQMANNRMGISLKHENSYGKLKIMAGIAMSQEIENLYKTYSRPEYQTPNNASFGGYAQGYNSISFQHRANQFTRSRFGYFQNNLGPYGNIINQYRRSFERIAITDSGEAGMSYRKGYNSLDFNWKYKIQILKRDFILSNYYNYTSVQDHASAIPLFTNKAFLRYFFTEFNAFYAVHPKLTVIGFYSIERALGNNRTMLVDANGELIKDLNTSIPIAHADGLPINQTGHGYGFGLDYDVSKRAGIYLRHRWFDHSDTNFSKDHFKGTETSLEFKIFF